MGSTIRWLHLTDLHVGMDDQDWLWPNMATKFRDDLKKIYDAAGPCGNPVKDALRVKTTPETTTTLTVVWGTAGFEERRDKAVNWYRELLERVGGTVQPIPVVESH